MQIDNFLSDAIRQKVDVVEERIAVAARSARRDPNKVRLVAVTKGHPVSTVKAAVAAGLRRLGENYVQEGLEKIADFESQPDLEWHMIGHIQSRKARDICQYFDYVHSVDRLKIAGRLGRYCEGNMRPMPVLLECNVSGEESKFGFPCWPGADRGKLFEDVENILCLPALRVDGLMTMAPFLDDPEEARPYFARLRILLDELHKRFGRAIGEDLSMGMSGDYAAAVEEGATIVRIGTAIFGTRP